MTVMMMIEHLRLFVCVFPFRDTNVLSVSPVQSLSQESVCVHSRPPYGPVSEGPRKCPHHRFLWKRPQSWDHHGHHQLDWAHQAGGTEVSRVYFWISLNEHSNMNDEKWHDRVFCCLWLWRGRVMRHVVYNSAVSLLVTGLNHYHFHTQNHVVSRNKFTPSVLPWYADLKN